MLKILKDRYGIAGKQCLVCILPYLITYLRMVHGDRIR